MQLLQQRKSSSVEKKTITELMFASGLTKYLMVSPCSSRGADIIDSFYTDGSNRSIVSAALLFVESIGTEVRHVQKNDDQVLVRYREPINCSSIARDLLANTIFNNCNLAAARVPQSGLFRVENHHKFAEGLKLDKEAFCNEVFADIAKFENLARAYVLSLDKGRIAGRS